MKKTLGLLDTVFSHDAFAIAGVSSEKVMWNRDEPFLCENVVFSHEMMLSSDRFKVDKKKRFGLLYESKAIVPNVYSQIPTVVRDFNLVFTHDSLLLREFSNTRWVPGSGVWIGGKVAPGRPGIHPKDKMVSMLSSNKVSCQLHRKRLAIAARLKLAHHSVDVFLQGWDFNGRLSPLETLEKYRYSIVMENFVDDAYFTEKILNCFATGTIPIYLGAKDIGKYFDPNGIIPFTGYQDLVARVLPSLSERDYQSRMGAIKSNLVIAQRYRSLEDFVMDEYGGEFHDEI